MKRYEFSDAERKALEKLRVPLAVYQFLNKRVVTVLVSDGFIELLGYDSREKTIYAMDNNVYGRGSVFFAESRQSACGRL